MSAITIDNDLVHYEVLGRGRPVVFVHGWLSSWRYWLPSMQHLSMKYRTYALDLWGYGDSSKDTEKLSLEAQVDLLSQFMDRLGIPKAAFIGHSLGAAVMVRYALLHPERVARLLLISPPVFEQGPQPVETSDVPPARLASRPPSPPTPTARRLPPVDSLTRPPAAAPGRLPEFRPPTTLSRVTVQNPPPRDPVPPVRPDPAANPLRGLLLDVTPTELLAQHLERETPEYDRHMVEASKTAQAALAASVASFDRINLALEIRYLVETPTLILHGQDDRFLPPPGDRVVQLLGGNRPTLRCEIVPSTGHFPMLSDPTNFQRLIMDFLEATDLTSLVLHKERWVRRVR